MKKIYSFHGVCHVYIYFFPAKLKSIQISLFFFSSMKVKFPSFNRRSLFFPRTVSKVWKSYVNYPLLSIPELSFQNVRAKNTGIQIDRSILSRTIFPNHRELKFFVLFPIRSKRDLRNRASKRRFIILRKVKLDRRKKLPASNEILKAW